MRSFSRGAGALLAGATLLVVAAIALAVLLAPRPAAPPVPTKAPTTARFPSAEPSFDIQLPLTTIKAQPGQRIPITSTSSRQVAVQTDVPVRVHLDCSLCGNLVTFTASGRVVHSGVGPWEGDVTLDPAGREGVLLRVDAVGRWTLTVTS